MTDFDGEQPPLPGLATPPVRESDLEAAARRTIRALDQAQLLEERDALTCQLVLDLAGAVATGRTSKRASAAAMAAAQLLAAMDRLPKPSDGGVDSEIQRLVEELRNAGRAAALRDPAKPGPVE